MVGTVLQDPDGQFIGLTVAEDIAFQMENEAVPLAEMKERVLQAGRTVEMEAYPDASPHVFVGGTKTAGDDGGRVDAQPGYFAVR